MLSGPVGFFFAFVIVLALIGAAAWAVRRFAGNRLGATAKGGRLPRLAVIDAAAVDGRRRLVLVRRDNVEHLLMIGGPTDIVVEPNIVRAAPARETTRPAPLPEPAGWAADADLPRSESFDLDEPLQPEPAPRAPRPSFADEARRPIPSPASERRDTHRDASGFSSEPMLRPSPEIRAEPQIRAPRGEPAMPRPMRIPDRSNEMKAPPVRTERPGAPVPQASAASAAAADQNLAEMAQRLEAALRRPGERPAAPPVAPDAPPVRPQRAAADKDGATVAANSAPPVAPPKATFEDLEEEMASLLGRPKHPT